MRLLYLVSHPIQYQAPLLRLIAKDCRIQLRVLFENMNSSGSYFDPGFQTQITWDTNLLDGYEHYAVNTINQINEYLSGTDVFWLHGWDTALKRGALNNAWRANVPVLMRGENTLTAMPDGRGIRGVLKRRYLRWIFRRCDAFLYIGSENRKYYSAHGVTKDRLFHMPYAIDNAYFSQATKGSGRELRKALGLEINRPIILFVGKFLNRKNPALLMDACRVMDRGVTRNPYLLFVGNGPEKLSLQKKAADTDWIKFLGFQNQSELPLIYSLADVFVMPSRTEPWGLAVNEAMAAGTAVITTTDCGCSADLVDDDVGRLVPANDGPALSKAIEEILIDREQCFAMGLAAQERIASWSFNEDLVGLKQAIKFVA